MRFRLSVLVPFLTLALAGCYVSKQELIAPADADYPFADGAHFDAFIPVGKNWTPKKTGRTLRRKGDHYVYGEDGAKEPSTPFLLKRVGKNRYIVQLDDSKNPARVSEHYYELFEFDGTTAIQYQGLCPAWPIFVQQGLVDKIEDTATPRCIFSDFAKLTKALEMAAKNAAPEGKYVLTKP